jgi:hypothetical protein
LDEASLAMRRWTCGQPSTGVAGACWRTVSSASTKPRDAVAAGEPEGVLVSVKDLRDGGEINLDGAAEPDPVPDAGPLVRRQAVRGPDGWAVVVVPAGKRGKRMLQGGFADPGERGQVLHQPSARQMTRATPPGPDR